MSVGLDVGRPAAAALDEEAVARLQSLCLCPTCPAYPEEDRGEKKAYCLRGDSAHKESIEPKDCFCENCEVYKHGRLYGSNYFCLEGAALKRGLENVLRGDAAWDLVDPARRAGPAFFISAGLEAHFGRGGPDARPPERPRSR